VGWSCGADNRQEENVNGFGATARGKETTWKTKALKGGWGQDRDRWRIVVNKVMNLRVLELWS
jgi:hypothetical protein